MTPLKITALVIAGGVVIEISRWVLENRRRRGTLRDEDTYYFLEALSFWGRIVLLVGCGALGCIFLCYFHPIIAMIVAALGIIALNYQFKQRAAKLGGHRGQQFLARINLAGKALKVLFILFMIGGVLTVAWILWNAE